VIVRSLELRRFRGIEKLTVVPRGHVVVVGEPRAGRSTVLEGLFRALSPDGARGTIGDDLDFHARDRAVRAEVEVVLGHLGDELSQRFFDALEYWDEGEDRLVDELDALDGLEGYEQVVRLCYRARWSAEQEQGEHWVDYPKTSDPEADAFDRVRRSDLAALPVFFGGPTTRPLALSYRGGLRELVDAADESDFASALEALATNVQSLGDDLAGSAQLLAALRAVIEPVAPALGMDADDLAAQVTFVPAGVALGALLRALEPTLQLDGAAPALPLTRHGSTAAAVLAAAELMARGERSDGVVAIDDFGEHIDAATAQHMAATLRRRTGQAWLSTRRAEVADAFRPEELVRLAFDERGVRTAHAGRRPATKSQRTAARHIALQLLPAMAARGVVVLEGPHDRAGLQAVADQRLREGVALPAAQRVALVDAGAVDASGGSSATPRLCETARHLGFFAVAVIDGDRDEPAVVAANIESADAVIRLPDDVAIERAVLDGVADEDIREALGRLDVQLPANLDDLAGGDLERLARKTLKGAGGLHAQFVDALPSGKVPALAARILDEATRCIVERDTGLHQL
jgi:putative ATP-dependent endonuclease of OLD family